MNYLELRSVLPKTRGMERLKKLYGGREGMLVEQIARYKDLIGQHEGFTADGEVLLISAPAARRSSATTPTTTRGKSWRRRSAWIPWRGFRAGDSQVRLSSAGYPPLTIDLSSLDPRPEEANTTAGLIRGVADRMAQLGFRIGGFDAAVISQVRSGSGLSSSAALMMVCCALDCLYNDGKMDKVLRAKICQYAENVHWQATPA